MKPTQRLSTLPLRLRSLFRRPAVDRELDEELRYHVERKTEDYTRRGIPRQEARRKALLELGGVEQVKENCRDQRKVAWLQDLFGDMKYGARILRRNPGFTAVIVIILALGVGSSTTILSIANATLRKGPDWYRQGVVVGRNSERNSRIFHFSIPEYVEMSRLQDIFEDSGALYWTNSALAAGQYPERVGCAHVTPSVIAMGTPMKLGRNFLREEDRPGGPAVAILSYEIWQQKFSGDPHILGRLIRIDGRQYQVIGVRPPYDSIFGSGVMVPAQLDLAASDRSNRHLWVLVTLRKEVSWSQADARLATLARAMAQENRTTHPEYEGLQLKFWDSHEAITADIRTALLVLLGAVGLLMLICCANISNLLLARASARRQEFGLRTALGASRARVTRQVVTESLLLSVVGGAVGVVMSWWCLPFVVHLIPVSWLNIDPALIRVDLRILTAAAALTVLVGVILGAAPAWQLSQASYAESLREGGRGVAGDRRGRRMRDALVVLEMALTLAILVGAASMIEGYRKLERIDLGFRPRHLLSLQISLPATKYPGAREVGTFYRVALDRVRGLPGVDGAALVSGLPMVDRTVDVTAQDFRIEGATGEGATGLGNANYRLVSPGYFEAMGARLIRGRVFDGRDRQGWSLVAVINEAMARRYWPSGDAVGQRIHLVSLRSSAQKPSSAGGADEAVTVVGVVSDVHQIIEIDAPVRQEFYLAEQQYAGQGRGLTMLVRSRLTPAALTPAIRHVIAGIDSEQPIYAVEPMEQVVSDAYGPKRIATVLLTFFAVVALVLSVVGIFGVLSYAVSRRAHEMGVRIALGATPREIVKLLVGQGLSLTALGLCAGLGMAEVLARVAGNVSYGVTPVRLFYQVDPLNPAILGLVVAVLLLAALGACWIPARRAARIDPMLALRRE